MNISWPAEANHHDPLPLHFKADRRGSTRTTATVRRCSDRLYGACQAIVRGRDEQGEIFTEATILDNVSAGGLYVKLLHKVHAGETLFVVFRLTTRKSQDIQVPCVATRGQVCRIESAGENTTGVGISFQRHRFL